MKIPPLPCPALGPAERVTSEFGPLWFRADDDVMRPAVRATGLWEPGETRLLVQLIRDGARFLDVGAHIGYFSAVAHRSGAGVVIHAVEPDPFTAALCELNLFAAGADATVWTAGLGDRRETLGFELATHNPGDGRLTVLDTARAVVPVVSADELFDGDSFDVIKIDVQGYETQVIQGMQQLIRRSKGCQVLVEFFPQAIADAGRRPIDVLEQYAAMGLTVRALVGDLLRELSFDEILAACGSAGRNGFMTLLLSRR